jgi:hypothetical protein
MKQKDYALYSLSLMLYISNLQDRDIELYRQFSFRLQRLRLCYSAFGDALRAYIEANHLGVEASPI